MTDMLSRLASTPFGGDYNPEQWPEEIWSQDMQMLEQASVNTVTLNVFSWARLQPSEDVYDFHRLDRIVETVAEAGMSIILGTATAAVPAWMAREYPDVTRVDIQGRKRHHGDRQNACPNSPTYRKYAARLAGHLAERYGNHPNLVLWHISNEYGGYCYCPNCAAAFRQWLENKYENINQLNEVWVSDVWGHYYGSFEDIFPPDLLGDSVDGNRSFLPAATLDYRRFQSDSLRAIYRLEKEEIRRHDKVTPTTTNFMLDYPVIDYSSWADDLDIVSWDCYPEFDTDPAEVSFWHSLMRGIKGGQSFLLMEQTPSRANWQYFNTLKRPGQMRQMSYQAIAHGADSIQFFQMRRSRSGPEKFHGAIIDHDGTTETRTFREVAGLGQELKEMGNQVLGAKTPSRVGVIFDWQSWWGFLGSVGPSRSFDYLAAVRDYYVVLHDWNIPVDVIPAKADFAKYDVILAPYLYMVDEGIAQRLRAFAEDGGRILVTTMSGITDENDRCHMGGVPGPLREICGVWAEETDALSPKRSLALEWNETHNEPGSVSTLFDVLHLEGARTLASYGAGEYYSGSPVFTVNEVGDGRIYYVAAVPDRCATKNILKEVLTGTGIEAIESPEGTYLPLRVGANDVKYRFYLNSSPNIVTVRVPAPGVDILTGKSIEGDCVLDPYGVAIVCEA